MCKTKVLFISKKRINSYGNSIGLFNSAVFVAKELKEHGIEAKVVSVVDNNCIDKEVFDFKPTHVVIEALWVIPEKFRILTKLHPKVKWIVRIHSKTPFISTEGIAIDWIRKYQELDSRIILAANSIPFVNDLQKTLNIKTAYLPNIYNVCYDGKKTKKNPNRKYVDVGCFGAIRPLKNQLIQAFAAIQFANKIGKKLRYHINATRIERGEEVFKNILATFPINGHELIQHQWQDHKYFIELVRQMDLGLQVSYSESFNIVAADFVVNDIPIIGSPDITWMSNFYIADPNSSEDIADALKFAWKWKKYNIQWLNKHGLNKHNDQSTTQWLRFVSKH